MRCVIADDNGIARDILRGAVVNDCGYEVVGEAKSGQEAIDLCRKHRPDVAILDHNMFPPLGEEAAKTILAGGFAKYVILASLSQHLVARWKAEGKKALSKPFKREKLAKEIKALL